MCCLLQYSNIPLKVSIVSRGDSALGYTQPDNNDKYLSFKNEEIADLCVLLGGRVSEELMCHDISSGASDDYDRAVKKMYNIVHLYTDVFKITDKQLMSERYKNELNNVVMKKINMYYNYVKETLCNYKNVIEIMTQSLLENETLDQDQIKQFVNEHNIKNNYVPHLY